MALFSRRGKGDDPATAVVEQGFYRFSNLAPDVPYQVEFDRTAGFIAFTRPNVNANASDTTDSDAVPTSGTLARSPACRPHAAAGPGLPGLTV